jgi:cyanobactin maturation PatA/PatG family protease
VDLSVTDYPSVLTGVRWLQAKSLGSPDVRVAVLDGPADLSHPCFSTADLSRVATMVQDPPGAGEMSAHGTHVASVIFGQPGSAVPGIAPRCKGLLLPVFRDPPARRLSQLDLGRAIEQAVQEGAHVINVSGGQRSPTNEADGILTRALKLCEDNNVLVIAAAGNDGCECLHVPAAVPSVLAVGALDEGGRPLETSNWGEAYRSNGVLATGERILGAAPGGDTAHLTGSSFATPIVSGIAALLLSIQRASGQEIDPTAVREAIVDSAVPCYPQDSPECRPYLVGTLNVPGAYDRILRGGKMVADSDAVQASSHVVEVGVGPGEPSSLASSGAAVAGAGLGPAADVPSGQPVHEHPAVAAGVSSPQAAPQPPAPAASPTASAGVVPSAQCTCNGGGSSTCTGDKLSNVFAIGIVGYDFGTEAGRDAFRQAMDPVTIAGSPPIVGPPNPYDARQLSDYLDDNPWDATKLIWTLELDGTPIYAIEPEPAFAGEVYTTPRLGGEMVSSSRVYRVLTSALRNHALDSEDGNYVSRVSVPGVLTTRTRRLFSGQEVPVVAAQARGLYTWNETALVNAVVGAVEGDRMAASPPEPAVSRENVAKLVRNFLDKIYYQLRNLGQSPPDRALNFAATNAFIFADGVREGLLSARYVPGPGDDLYTLDTINVVKSPYCRMDSDCWDVQVTFFDAEEVRRARVVYQYTIDVSAVTPVSLAPTHRFLNAP